MTKCTCDPPAAHPHADDPDCLVHGYDETLLGSFRLVEEIRDRLTVAEHATELALKKTP